VSGAFPAPRPFVLPFSFYTGVSHGPGCVQQGTTLIDPDSIEGRFGSPPLGPRKTNRRNIVEAYDRIEIRSSHCSLESERLIGEGKEDA